MTNFQSMISFSERHFEKRILKAREFIDENTLNRSIGLSLFLLGGKRVQISKFLKIPVGTFFSFLNRFSTTGIKALIDKRKKGKLEESDDTAIKKTEGETIHPPLPYLEVIFGDQKKVLTIPYENNRIIINDSNPLQFKTMILTFMNSGFLTPKETSDLLGISERQVRNLNENLQNDDINSFIDKRQGQKKDYVFTENIKAELIQQYTANIVTGGSTSSSEIAKLVNEECNSSVSARAVREHVLKLGLNKIKDSLPKLLRRGKKTPNLNK